MDIKGQVVPDEVGFLIKALRIALGQCADKGFSFFERAKKDSLTEEFSLPDDLTAKTIWIEIVWLGSQLELRTEEMTHPGVENLTGQQPQEVLRVVLKAMNGVLELGIDLYIRPSGTIEHWNEIFLHPATSLNLSRQVVAKVFE